jgi:hypothetical protein
MVLGQVGGKRGKGKQFHDPSVFSHSPGLHHTFGISQTIQSLCYIPRIFSYMVI